MTWANVAGAAVGVIGGAMLGGGDTPSSASNMPSQTPEQQAALQQLLQLLTGRSNATTPYGGQLSAGMTGGQNASLAALEQQSMNAAEGFGNARATLDSAMNDTGTNTSEYFRTAVEDPAIKSFQERILPSITGRFAGNAAFGSDRIAAEGKAAGDLTSSLAGARSKMAFDSQEAAKTRRLTAAGMVPGVNKTFSDMLTQLFTAQSVPQSIQQTALDKQYQEFQRQQAGGQTNINQILAALGLQPLNTVVTPGQPGFLTGMAPGFGQALANRWLNPQTSAAGGSSSSPFYTGTGIQGDYQYG